MPTITLPDNSTKHFDGDVTPYDVAASIGERLAKQSVGARINGELADLHHTIEHDATLAIITTKPRDDEQRADLLFLIRHSAAHIMAEAIQRIIPEADLVYGPPLDTGFYYDIRFPDDRPLREGDFEAIEAEMAKIVAEDRPFTRYELPVDQGLTKLNAEGSKYKLDNAQRAIEAGATHLSWYATGEPDEHWEDLCRGPHVPTTGFVKAFKVLSLASSYWHGDANSDALTRVYGTAFPSQKELDEHLEQLEQARQRDHRVIGRKLGLFLLDEMVGQGLLLWTPKGAVIRDELQKFISEELRRQGYDQVFTPHIGKLDLYRTSGHFPYYKDSQYPAIAERDVLNAAADEGCSCGDLMNQLESGEAEGYMLRPMNCPHHIRIYASQPHSYRDLPIRLAEFGTVYRWEQSGELNGMTRVRGMTQDDAHLFCTPDQVEAEIDGCLQLVRLVFDTLGMRDFRVRVGLRDPDAAKYVGDADVWDKAEAILRNAAATLGAPYTEAAGEAAFYGPKIDFIVRDVIGREWQLGTVQLDYNLPERFDLSYIGPDNKPHRPVMIHRAPFGSMERFIGVLIEHFAGAFPLWLSPEQVRVLPISEKTNTYAHEVFNKLRAAGLRATVDNSNERVQAKIKKAADDRLPYMAIVGPRDAEAAQVSLRIRGLEKDAGAMPTDEFVNTLAAEARTRGEHTLTAKLQHATTA
ncbi:MAG: threonine--tRNA ligase [Planctomycetota bacterium]